MTITDQNIPDDPSQLRQFAAKMLTGYTELEGKHSDLEDKHVSLEAHHQAEIQNRDMMITKLRHQLFGLRKDKFGSSGEGLDQLGLRLEEEPADARSWSADKGSLKQHSPLEASVGEEIKDFMTATSFYSQLNDINRDPGVVAQETTEDIAKFSAQVALAEVGGHAIGRAAGPVLRPVINQAQQAGRQVRSGLGRVFGKQSDDAASDIIENFGPSSQRMSPDAPRPVPRPDGTPPPPPDIELETSQFSSQIREIGESYGTGPNPNWVQNSKNADQFENVQPPNLSKAEIDDFYKQYDQEYPAALKNNFRHPENPENWAQFPPNDGAAIPPYSAQLNPPARIDRFGGRVDDTGSFTDGGKFFGEPGASYTSRAMEPKTGPFAGNGEKKILTEYELLKPIEVEIAPAAPWFEKASDGLESGGALQYRFKDPENPGKYLDTDKLIEDGYLRVISRGPE